MKLSKFFGVTLATVALLSLSSLFALAYESPPGWFAVFVSSSGRPQPTDPINLVVSDPSGKARQVFEGAITKGLNGKWKSNTCYNSSIIFLPPGYLLYQSPNSSFSTDNSDSGDFLGYRGCGSQQRNHLRLWTSSDGKTVYIAASIEKPNGHGHTVISDGYDSGRNELSDDLSNGLINNEINFSVTRRHLYSNGSLQGVNYDGNVDDFEVVGGSFIP